MYNIMVSLHGCIIKNIAKSHKQALGVIANIMYANEGGAGERDVTRRTAAAARA